MARLCTICTHPQRTEIDQAIVSGEKYRIISQRFGVSEAAIGRHKKSGHIAKQIAKVAKKKEVNAAKEIQKAVDAKEQRDLASVDKLLSIIEGLLGECGRTIKDARISGDDGLKLRAIREARDTARVLLEAHGKINDGTTVNVNTIENQWHEFRTVTLEVMCPDCREAVVRMLRARQER